MTKMDILNAKRQIAPFAYANQYYLQDISADGRLCIGPTSGHTGLLQQLAATWPTRQYFLLYVLLVSQTDHQPGRYQSPLLSQGELAQFLQEFGPFIDGDGRHHLWLGSPANEGMLIYDQHNVIYAYGAMGPYLEVLAGGGFSEANFLLPAPHVHHYHSENAVSQQALLEYFDWTYFVLQEGDDY